MTTGYALRQLGKLGPITRRAPGLWYAAPCGEDGHLIEICASSSGPDYPDGYDPAAACVLFVGASIASSLRQALGWARHA